MTMSQINVRGQQGATLIVALVFLLAMSLIALTSLNTATLEEKMAANLQSNITVFQAAESAAENVLANESLLRPLTEDNPFSVTTASYDSNGDGTVDVDATMTAKFLFTDAQAADGATARATRACGSINTSNAAASAVTFYQLVVESESSSNSLGQSTVVQGVRISSACQ